MKHLQIIKIPNYINSNSAFNMRLVDWKNIRTKYPEDIIQFDFNAFNALKYSWRAGNVVPKFLILEKFILDILREYYNTKRILWL
jgi:hypothetical protein